MPTLETAITIRDLELDDEELEMFTQNFLWRIREFDGVEEAYLPVQEAFPESSKAIGAFLLGTVTVSLTPRALIEIIDLMEEKWLKPEESRPNRRSLWMQVNIPEKVAIFEFDVKNLEDLKAFRSWVTEHMDGN